MVIVYTTTRYASRYFPALDTTVTFPVIYQYTAGYRTSTEGYIDNYNMTNDSRTVSSGVIIQRRPSVIKEVPSQNENIVNERERETIDVVGIDGVDDGLEIEQDGLKTEQDGLETKQDGLETKEEEGAKTRRKRESTTVETGRRRTKRKRVDLVEKDESGEDIDWKPSENKRHVCDECGMRFKKPSALVIHIRTHSGERPYSCELCDKSFSISGNLRRHMFTHTGEKPYKCRACGRAFNNPSHLARHSKKIHI